MEEKIIGILTGVFTTLAAVPQIIKAIRSKKTTDLSYGMFLSLCIGVVLWTVYGIIKNNWPIIIANGISFILNGFMLFIKIKKRIIV